MAKLTKFDKATARQVHETVREMLGNFSDIGLKVARSTGRFDANTLKLTIELSIDSPDSEKKVFDSAAPLVGLTPTDYHRIVDWNAEKFRIVGVMPRSRKYPIIAIRQSDGKRFKLPARAATPRRWPVPAPAEA